MNQIEELKSLSRMMKELLKHQPAQQRRMLAYLKDWANVGANVVEEDPRQLPLPGLQSAK